MMRVCGGDGDRFERENRLSRRQEERWRWLSDVVAYGYFTVGMGWGEEQGRLIWGVEILLFFFLFNIFD